MKRFSLTLLLAGLLSGAIACQRSIPTAETPSPSSEGLPGEGITVTPVQMTTPDDFFQARVVDKLLEQLGYEVAEPEEVSSALIFVALANGDADYTAASWERVHAPFYKKNGGNEKFAKMGVMVENTALGYQIDKKTADEHNITSLAQLKEPEIAKLFDTDGNGKANLAGCDPGWGCEPIIEHHLDAYGLRETVEHDQGLYALLIADRIARYEQGEPILIYTWVPSWVAQVFQPDETSIWLEVPHTDLPDAQKDLTEKDTTVNGKNLGFPVDRIRMTANKEFIDANPAAKRLFELIEIPIEDISAQNKRLHDGEKDLEDIDRHAEEWIENNQDIVDRWLEEARQIKAEN